MNHICRRRVLHEADTYDVVANLRNACAVLAPMSISALLQARCAM
jgi:hypothetical protein